MRLVVIFFCLLIASNARKGIDISQKLGVIHPETWACLRNQGYDFAIIQAFNGNYLRNKYLQTNVEGAWRAGFQSVDLLLFSCNNCEGNTPAELPIREVIDYANQVGIKYNRLWIDVEPCERCWKSGHENLNHLEALANIALNKGADVGIYSQTYCWNTVTEFAKSVFLNQFKLWYADFNGEESFGDSKAYSFGGWREPFMKQIWGGHQEDLCGVTVGVNWVPDDTELQC